MAQDEIIIDIDESELAVVQDEFGEIDDEFDEFALMDRRQAVIETLQEEVEVEDLSRRDASALAVVEEEDDDEADVEPEAGAADLSEEAAEPADAPGAGDTADAADAADADDAKKKRRRRRRKKAAPLVVPELTAPPHKDFWEVWAAKYTFHDFEDEKFAPPNNVPEVEDEPPPAPVPEARPARAPARSQPPRPAPARSAPRPATAEADDVEFTKVILNLGRTHGHKAATIRGLLREHLDLEGRAIRDLTVRDGDTLFRVHASEVERIQGALASVREGGVQLAVQPAPEEAQDLRAPLPDDLGAGAALALGATEALAASLTADEPSGELPLGFAADPAAHAEDPGTT